jgi:hypothetical protein
MANGAAFLSTGRDSADYAVELITNSTKGSTEPLLIAGDAY